MQSSMTRRGGIPSSGSAWLGDSQKGSLRAFVEDWNIPVQGCRRAHSASRACWLHPGNGCWPTTLLASEQHASRDVAQPNSEGTGHEIADALGATLGAWRLPGPEPISSSAKWAIRGRGQLGLKGQQGVLLVRSE